MPKSPQSLQTVENLIQLAHKYGVLEIEALGIKVKLSQPTGTQLPEVAAKEIAQPGSMPSDEDLLLWSAGGTLPSEARKAQLEAGDTISG